MKSLVTVKDAEEARRVARERPEIIDVKNPSEGSLGAPSVAVLREVMDSIPDAIQTSVAVGDAPNLPGTVSLAVRGASIFGPDYIKVGLKGAENGEEAYRIAEKASEGLDESRSSLVVAGYADYREVNSVDIERLPEIARKTGAEVVMVDTAAKDGKTLFDYVQEEKLGKMVDEAKDYGLDTAAAGSLSFENIDDVRDIGFDIFGVRGAVCKGDSREGEIDRGLVSELVEMG